MPFLTSGFKVNLNIFESFGITVEWVTVQMNTAFGDFLLLITFLSAVFLYNTSLGHLADTGREKLYHGHIVSDCY